MNRFHKSISRVSGAALLMSLCAAHAAAAVDLSKQIEFNIPSGRLSDALIEFSKQAHVQVLTSGERAAQATTEGVSGTQTLQNALLRLLDSSGLEFQVMSESAIAVREAASKRPTSGGANLDPRDASFRVAQAEVTESSASPARRKEELADVKRLELEEILVTGSHIRGAEPTSQVITITQQEMRLSGHNNLGEVMRALPQNFAGGQNPGVALGAEGAQSSNVNVTSGSGANLRGLGPDATLTLLNGTRLPYDGLHQATDVSVIPVSAIDRVEVLLDGASAIYGSDAVGGVVNVILKRDYQGAELSARFGTATDGGYDQAQYTALAGHSWESGGFLIAGDASRNTPVRVNQRDYLGYLSVQSTMLYPGSDQKSAFVSGHQDVGRWAELTLDAFYTERASENQFLTTLRAHQDLNSTIWGVAPAVTFALPREWALRVHGFLGRDESEVDQQIFNVATGALFATSGDGNFNESEAASVETEGPLFPLPGGAARLSTGGGWRNNTYDRVNLLTGATSITGESRSYYGYGEINLPFVSEDQNIPFLRRFSLNGAVRYDHYNIFGGSTTPKIGMVWSPARSFDVKASWGRSFKVPKLAQQFSSGQLALFTTNFFAGAPTGRTVVIPGGGNPDLEPERAEVITAGFVVEPEFLPRFRLEVGWFGINYTERVVSPLTGVDFSAALVDPTLADFVTFNPTVAQLDAAFTAAGLPVGTFTSNSGNPNFTPRPYDPSEVYAILDGRNTNAITNRVNGVDLSARYATDLFGGVLTLSANGDWILDAERRLRSLAPEQETSGLVFWPAEFKGRLGASWSRNGFTLSSIVNHISGVTNNLFTPHAKGASMTTLDLVFDQQIDSDLVGNMAFNIAVTNAFDRRPPFMRPQQNFYVNYDSTNYSALGRVVSATITKRF